MLFCDARHAARRDEHGRYVPFEEQLLDKWDMHKIHEAEAYLREASQLNVPGPFQLEAAIQSAHTFRRLSGRDNWNEIVSLYSGLLHYSRTVGAVIGYASALAEVAGPHEALLQLEGLEPERVNQHLPYWALRASLLSRLARHQEALVSHQRAIGLATDPAVRSFLQEQAALVMSELTTD